MLIVNKSEGKDILIGEKTSSLRPIKANGKGYLKEGGLYWFHVGRNFKEAHLCRFLMLNVSFVNVDELEKADFWSLGYDNKAEYMAQNYNQRNPSRDRVRYDFITVSNLLNLIESLEITPENFVFVWEMVKNSDLAKGVDISLIYEGCDLEDLEGAFLTVQANIWEQIHMEAGNKLKAHGEKFQLREFPLLSEVMEGKQ